MLENDGAQRVDFIQRVFRMPPAEIGYLRFLLESYDGLGFVRTLDGRQALVEIAFSPSRRQDAEALLSALAAECAMAEVSALPPDEFPPL